MLVLLAAFALHAATPGEDPLAAAYGNTLVSTYPDGRTARLWLSPGGRYTGQGRRGGRNAGVWSVRGASVCFSQRRPIPVPIRYCTPMVTGGVGTRWTARAVTGETIRVEVVPGRQTMAR